MKRILSAIALLSLVFAVLYSCDTTTPSTEAERISISDLGNNPGFSWFQGEVAAYTPDSNMVKVVASAFQPDRQRVCIFVRPSCGCRGTQKLFPQIMKTLMAANIDMGLIEVWGMRNPSDNNPYTSVYQLQSLPTIVVMRSGGESARIIDADYNEVNADSLIAAAVSR